MKFKFLNLVLICLGLMLPASFCFSGTWVQDGGDLAANQNGSFPDTVSPTVTPTSILSGSNQIKALHNDFNPSRGESTTILWRQGAGGNTTIKIYTVYGKLVRTLVSGENFAANVDVQRTWDGKNDAGSIVASGIYLVYIQAGSFKDRVKVAVIKE